MANEIKVRLKNRVLKVPAEDKEKYLQQGYTVYDMAGNVIAEPATDANKLKGAKAEIASLTAKLKEAEEYAETRDKELDAAKAELDALKTELDAAKAEITAKGSEIASLTAKLKEAEAADKTAAKATKTSGKDTTDKAEK